MSGDGELNELPVLFDSLIDNLIAHETWSIELLALKLTEETGELAEHIFVEYNMKSKQLDEPIENEAADVINCAIAVVVRKMVLCGYSSQDIKKTLMNGISAKNEKYINNLKKKSLKREDS